MLGEVRLIPVPGIPEVTPGADIARLILQALRQADMRVQDGDVLVVTQKIISKAEGRLVSLSNVEPSALAVHFATEFGKDPREVEVVLQETDRVVRMAGGSLIVQTRHGLVCANAGVDHSNVGGGQLCLLPIDPDASAGRIRDGLMQMTGVEVAVIISDTFGRPWRLGQTNVAIGVAGMRPIMDYRGMNDAEGRELKVTMLAVADELAAAAELTQNKLDKVPVTIVRGYSYPRGEGSARELVRPAEKDLFR
ncbi:MAG TPA: coenzyme F420-0:L-glutamate ligase [Symbiobacteriaceae bacterium]|nr:coenzyme F420-0:L-glutamate ligase [Symbiobacteriaceae bacterium]